MANEQIIRVILEGEDKLTGTLQGASGSVSNTHAVMAEVNIKLCNFIVIFRI